MMKKRILILALALALVLASVPAHAAAGERYTLGEFGEAIENGELGVLYVGLGGAWMDIADGETQVWLDPASKVYVDPEDDAPEGYNWIYVYQKFMAADGSIVWRLVGMGLVRSADMSIEQPKLLPGYGAFYVKEEHLD